MLPLRTRAITMRRKSIVLLFSLIALVGLVSACSRGGNSSAPNVEGTATIQLTSPAFAEGAAIPDQYTCDGPNISPPLKWSSVPQGTKSIALIVEDPDAPLGTFTHWVIFSISPSVTELPERVPTMDVLPDGVRQGINDMRRTGYGGPCPPTGSHRYFFKLYALDIELSLKPGATKKDLVSAMEGHVLALGQLMGTYKRN
jgi:Raf kinase inhibitor-like YbhB/YbcL family protein